ncbi:MAG: hypothetical protein QXF56_00125 [Candidatus Micrarchaeia archaeon]
MARPALPLIILGVLAVLIAVIAVYIGYTSTERATLYAASQTADRGMRQNFTSGFWMANISAACEGKSEGDTCFLQTPKGNETGTCQTHDETLICVGNWQRPYES